MLNFLPFHPVSISKISESIKASLGTIGDDPSTSKNLSEVKAKSNICLIILVYRESNCFMVPSVVLQQRERQIKLKATKEEYLRNLRELAAAKEEQKRCEQEEQEEFEALARESVEVESSVEFSEIIETTETTYA